jgi:hypothetical protein
MIALGGNTINWTTAAEEYINDDGTTNVLRFIWWCSTIKALQTKKDYKPDPKLSVNYIITPTEMVKIFGRLNQPMVTETGYAIPSLH